MLAVSVSKAHAAAAQLQLQQSKHTLWTTESKQQKVVCASYLVCLLRRTNLQKGTSKKPNTFRVELPAGVEVDGKAKPDRASPGGECTHYTNAVMETPGVSLEQGLCGGLEPRA